MINLTSERTESQEQEQKTIKCVVWDLDNTLWNGILLENDKISLHNHAARIITTLDSRGILQSIASKNERNLAMAKLREMGLDEYFLYPQINWNSKAASIKEIAKSLNISLDAIAFIDDGQFELEEVSFSLPEVLCIDAAKLDDVLDMPEMNPRFITEDSQLRRLMYINDIERQNAEKEFVGSSRRVFSHTQHDFDYFLCKRRGFAASRRINSTDKSTECNWLHLLLQRTKPISDLQPAQTANCRLG